MSKFILTSPYQPTGDQPEAIRELTDGLRRGDKSQVLLGVTGSGKTFTMANVIANINRPTLILSHNKTLAAQLYVAQQDAGSPVVRGDEGFLPGERGGILCQLL